MTEPIKYKCGCLIGLEGNVWKISSFCNQHTPNYKKKAEKMILKSEAMSRRRKLREAEYVKIVKKRREK